MDTQRYLTILAEETGVARDELESDTEFRELGVNHVLRQVIADRLEKEASIHLPLSTFDAYPDVGGFIQHINELARQRQQQPTIRRDNLKTVKQNIPLIQRLQGDPKTARKTLFLLPDGSGSGMAYARLPPLGPDICLCGINSPFLGAASITTTIENMASTFATAILEVQPQGPYLLGGWSAGGYFATEVARLLLLGDADTFIECIVLIDSPCRLEYGALPMEALQFLAPRNLMGNWGSNKSQGAPTWLVDHFEGTVDAVGKYMPVPIKDARIPSIFIIEASEGVLRSMEEVEESGLDKNNLLTMHFLGPRPTRFAPHGWERVFPLAQLWWARTSGSHFNLVHPPHSVSLGSLLQDIIKGQVDKETGGSMKWQCWQVKNQRSLLEY